MAGITFRYSDRDRARIAAHVDTLGYEGWRAAQQLKEREDAYGTPMSMSEAITKACGQEKADLLKERLRIVNERYGPKPTTRVFPRPRLFGWLKG